MPSKKKEPEEKPACERCGQVHPTRCTAHKKNTDPLQPCGQNRVEVGATVCWYHGGATKAHRAKAAKRREEMALEKDANALLATYGKAGVGDPFKELQTVVAQNKAMLTALGKRLNSLDALEVTDYKGAIHAKTELVAFERTLERAMKGYDLLLRHQPAAVHGQTKSLLADLAGRLGVAPETDDEDDWDEDDLL